MSDRQIKVTDGRVRYSKLCLESAHASLEKKAPHKGTFGFAIECHRTRSLTWAKFPGIPIGLLEELRIEYQGEIFCHSTIWSIWRNFPRITPTGRRDHFLPSPSPRRVFQFVSSEDEEQCFSSLIAASTPIISLCLGSSLDSLLNGTEVFMLLFLWVLPPNSIVTTINSATLNEALRSSPPLLLLLLAGVGRR